MLRTVSGVREVGRVRPVSRERKAPADERMLRDLAGVGQSIARDLSLLGVVTVKQLAQSRPDELYDRLSERAGKRQDPCVLDTFRCAVAQARNPNLPPEQCNWWWWSQQRKANDPAREIAGLQRRK